MAQTSPRKASSAQAVFINQILKHGGDRVPGRKVFGSRSHVGPDAVRSSTIDSCKRREWVIKDETAGTALWTVTPAGKRAAHLGGS